MHKSSAMLLPAALIGLTSLQLASCASDPAVAITVGLFSTENDIRPNHPEDEEDLEYFKTNGTIVNLVVFSGGCPADEYLREGDTYGCKVIVPFQIDEYGPTMPNQLSDIGTLDRKKYGFAAFLHTEKCELIGFGCTEADLDKIRTIHVSIINRIDPERECDFGESVCGDKGWCLPQKC